MVPSSVSSSESSARLPFALQRQRRRCCSPMIRFSPTDLTFKLTSNSCTAVTPVSCSPHYVRRGEGIGRSVLLHSSHRGGCSNLSIFEVRRFVPGIEGLLEMIKEVEHEFSSPLIGDFIPALSFLDVWKKIRVRRIHRRMDSILSALIVKRKQAMLNSSSSSFDDLLEVLLSKEANQNGCAGSAAVEDALTVEEMKAILLEILGGGIITTALTIEWGLAELLKHPRCLQRLRKEIEEALPKKGNDLIREEDIANVDFLKSVVKEVARLHPAVPMLVPRISTQECEIGGYIIPPQTLAFVNVWGISRDESVWPNALQFLPERFEGKDVELRGQHFELLPFGSGRRICMGLPLAVSMVGLTLANLIHHFDWQLPEGQTPETLNMDESNGLNLNKAVLTMVVPKPRFMTTIANAPV